MKFATLMLLHSTSIIAAVDLNNLSAEFNAFAGRQEQTDSETDGGLWAVGGVAAGGVAMALMGLIYSISELNEQKADLVTL